MTDPLSSAKAVSYNSPSNPPICLNKDDQFESAIIEIVLTNRQKRADYASDDDIFSNFKDSSDLLGISEFGTAESILHLIGVKLARLKNLRANGRLDEPKNESVTDTYLDLAVYACLLFAWSAYAD